MYECALCGYRGGPQHVCVEVLAARIAKLEADAARQVDGHLFHGPPALGPKTREKLECAVRLAPRGESAERAARETARLIADDLRRRASPLASNRYTMLEAADCIERGDWGKE